MKDLALLDLVDRVIDKGVIVAGDVTLSVANVDLIYLGLRVLLAPVQRLPELLRRPETTPTTQPGAAHVDFQAARPSLC